MLGPSSADENHDAELASHSRIIEAASRARVGLADGGGLDGGSSSSPSRDQSLALLNAEAVSCCFLAAELAAATAAARPQHPPPGGADAGSGSGQRATAVRFRSHARQAMALWGRLLSERSAEGRGPSPPLRHAEASLRAMTRIHQLSAFLGETTTAEDGIMCGRGLLPYSL